jgi:hypothetical protein
MGSRIEHRAAFSQDVAAVLAASSDEVALRARLEELGGESAALLEHSVTPDGVRFKIRQGITADRLPQAVRTMHKGDLIVEREQTFTRAGDGYTGAAKASVNGLPAEITAQTELKREGGQTVLRTSGEVKVRIPLLGAKLENLIAEQITKLLDREAEFTSKWLAENE